MKKIRLWAIVLVMAFTAVVSAMIGTGCSKKDFEVTFALPDTATEAERQITTLPEKITVPSGTTIGSLETASRLSSTFLTWSYDAAGNERAAETDVIDRDLTLYPVFALMDGMGDAKGFDYVSKTDVGTDYVIELISYGLTEEEIRERLTVENASFGGEPVEFTLLSIRLKEAKEWLLSDGFDDETAEKILTCIREKDADKTVKLRERLSTLAEDPALSGQLTYAKVTDIVSRYAPQELESNEFVNDPSIDEGLKSVLAAMGIDLATATADEVREYFGLPEDDSLERYFREDVGLSVEQVLALEEILYKKKEVRVDKWQLIPEGGEWEGGLIYSVIASDTAKLRYIYDEEPTGKEVVKYNITVHQETVENISIDPRVIHVPASEVSGVEYLGLLSLDMDEDGQIQADENSGSGALTYTGTEVFRANDILAINQGDVDEKGLTNGDVAYVRITGVMGDGIYSYEYAQLTDVLFIADTIPVKDDGSMDDGKITIDLSAYDFSDPKYLEFGLDETTGLDVGDYLAFYTGTFGGEDFAVKGHGIITAVTKAGDIANVTYDLKTEEEILEPELLLYTKLPEMEFEITEPDNEKLRQEMEQQIADSGLVGETQEFFKTLLTDGSLDFDAYEHGDELRSMIIKTDGEDMTLADLRKLADGGKVEVSDVHVTFLAGINLQHFEGKKGLRGEAAVWFTINIAIGDAGSLEIQPAIIFEQEFLLTPSVKVKRNKNKVGFTSSLDITASFEAGTYSGLGVTVTAKTKAPENANKDKDFSEMVGGFIDNGDKDSLEARQKAAKMLIKGGDFLQKQADKQKKKGQGQGFDATPGNNNDPKTGSDSKQDYVSPGLGGDLPTKYSSMLSNDAKYINLVNVDLGSFDLPIDPAGIIHVGLKINFNIAMKINAMIGAGITYENAKCYSYHFRAKIWGGGDEYKTKNLSGENYSSVTDIKESTFRADFYAFGMVGVRMGVSLDLRVGIFSTDLDSVGVVASAGVYAELYGFLYVYYEKVASLPAKSGASGSLLFEVGIYADISVKVQVGAGKASKSWSLYSLKTPLVQLGCTEFPLDFLIKPNDSKLSVKIKDGENTVKLDDSIFKMKLMALNSGKVSDKNMDSKVVSESDGTRYTAELVTSGQTEDTKGLVLSTKRSWTQCNEEHFTVECFDLTKENGERIKGASSFQYLPGTNEIYICPIDNTKSDVWGEVVFTYRNNAFGFNTEKLQRTVKVHWHGTKRVAKVEYYLQDNSQRDSIYSFKLEATGKVSGYDGVRCYVEVTPEFCDMYPGYTLHYLGYPDEEELKAKYDEISDRYHKERNHANYLAKVALEARVGNTSDKEKDAAAAEAYKQANNTFDTLQFISSLYKEYYDNNMAAVWNRQGTTYFTLRGTETVVAVYFRKQDTPTCWTVFNDDGTWVTSTSYYRQADGTYTDQYWKQALLKDVKTLDQMPTLMEGIDEGHYTVKWYSFEFDTSGGVWRDIAGDQKWVIEGLIRDNKYLTDSRVKPVDENTVYNGNWMTIFAVRTPDTCKAHWMVDEDEFKVTEVPYGRLVTAPSEIPFKEGFEFVEWTTEDGLAITSDLTMTDDDIYLYASFLGDAHTVTWITDDGKEAESEALTGVSIYGAVPEELRFDDKLYIWRTDKDDKSTELPYLSEMPNKDMTYYGRLAVGFSKITWIDGEEEIRSDYVEVGTPPTAPELAAKDDLDLVWMIDGEVMQTNFVMSRTDVKAIANRHKHVWDDAKEVTIEATCSASGLKGPACSVCGYIKDGVEIPADPNNHKWLNYVAEKPTCAKEGTTKQHCAWCVAINPNFSQPIEKDPEEHVGGTELRNYVKPTCQEGYSGDTYCLGCGVMLEEGHKLEPTGEHPSVRLVGEKEPTCLEPGYTGDWVCNVCNEIAKQGSLIRTTVHVNENVENIPATCIEPLKVVWKCIYCGHSWTVSVGSPDDNAHEWDDGVITREPNCGVKGIKVFTCSVCHKTREESLPTVGEHVFDDGVITKEPTCVERGEQTYTCTVCGEKKVYSLNIDRDNHAELGERVVDQEPTCLDKGSEKAVCAACGNTVFYKDSLDALGHDWTPITYTWADDYSKVTASRECRRNHIHDETETVKTEANITGDLCSGQTAVYTSWPFTVYSETFKVQTKTVNTPAQGHNWGAPTYTWAADNSSVTATRVCSRDASHKETEMAQTTSRITKEATEFVDGEHTYTATFRNSAFKTQNKVVADIPHWSSVTYTWAADNSTVTATRTGATTETETAAATATVIKAATCTEAGSTKYTASFTNPAFGNTEKTVTTAALGHQWNLTNTVNPAPIISGDVCTGWRAGSKTYVCAHNSSHTKTDVIKVPVYVISAYQEDFTSVSGNTVTINMKGAFEADNRWRASEGLPAWTFSEWLSAGGDDPNNATLQKYLINSFFVQVLPYGPGYENWWSRQDEMTGVLMQFQILNETTGNMAFVNSADAGKKVIDYHGQLQTQLRFTPSDTNTYESLSPITVNIILP